MKFFFSWWLVILRSPHLQDQTLYGTVYNYIYSRYVMYIFLKFNDFKMFISGKSNIIFNLSKFYYLWKKYENVLIKKIMIWIQSYESMFEWIGSLFQLFGFKTLLFE